MAEPMPPTDHVPEAAEQQAAKDYRTAEASKWADDYLPPTSCGDIDSIQNALELLRDANSQLRHVAHFWKHVAHDELQRRRNLGEAITFGQERFAEIIRICGIVASPQERLLAVCAAAQEGRAGALNAARDEALQLIGRQT